MVAAFRAAVEIVLQLFCMDHLMAAGTFDPAAETIFFRGLNFNFRFIPGKKAHKYFFTSIQEVYLF